MLSFAPGGRALAETVQLIMFESAACSWCEQWDEEIAPIYPKTEEARIAPLRRVSVDDDLPADLAGLKSVVYTPTFVLMAGNREVGRILGYPGEDFFWALLDELMVKLARAQDRGRLSSDQSAASTDVCRDAAAPDSNQVGRKSC
jgi:thioredoxin-related protein